MLDLFIKMTDTNTIREVMVNEEESKEAR